MLILQIQSASGRVKALMLLAPKPQCPGSRPGGR